MRIELFGTSRVGLVEFLGTFNKEETLFEAMDQYEGMGYKNIKYCNWKVK